MWGDVTLRLMMVTWHVANCQLCRKRFLYFTKWLQNHKRIPSIPRTLITARTSLCILQLFSISMSMTEYTVCLQRTHRFVNVFYWLETSSTFKLLCAHILYYSLHQNKIACLFLGQVIPLYSDSGKCVVNTVVHDLVMKWNSTGNWIGRVQLSTLWLH